MKVTQKQENFCQHFVKHGSMTDAYISAYETKNMKYSVVGRRASDMVRKPNVAQRLNEIRQEIIQANKPVLDKVVAEIANIAMFDIAELYDENGNFKDINSIPKAARSSIVSIKTFEEYDGKGKSRKSIGQVREVKILNKLDAFEKLMKHLGGYEMDNGQKGNKVMIIQVPDNGR